MSNAATSASTAAVNAARRASAFAFGAVVRSRKLIKVAGCPTREIPENVKFAKDLADASLRIIAPRVASIQQQAHIMRLGANPSKGRKRRNAQHEQLRRGDPHPDGDDNDESDNSSSQDDVDDDDDDNDDKSSGDESNSLDCSDGAILPPSNEAHNGLGGDAVAIRKSFDELSDAIDQQRKRLPAHEVNDFDSAWGIDPTGQFHKRSLRTYWSISQFCAEKTIKHELSLIHHEVKKKIEKLAYADDDHIGLEMLHLFVLDLLGRDTNAAKIFNSKTGWNRSKRCHQQ